MYVHMLGTDKAHRLDMQHFVWTLYRIYILAQTLYMHNALRAHVCTNMTCPLVILEVRHGRGPNARPSSQLSATTHASPELSTLGKLTLRESPLFNLQC